LKSKVEKIKNLLKSLNNQQKKVIQSLNVFESISKEIERFKLDKTYENAYTSIKKRLQRGMATPYDKLCHENSKLLKSAKSKRSPNPRGEEQKYGFTKLDREYLSLRKNMF